MSAFIYGNILVLSAVVQVAPEQVQSGAAVVVVAATMVTTYVAHVVADLVGLGLGAGQGDDAQEAGRHSSREIRDALPIISSGGPPIVLLGAAALGWMDWLSPSAVVLVAAGFVVVRLAATGFVASRFHGRSPRQTLWTGVTLALVGLMVAVAKVALTH